MTPKYIQAIIRAKNGIVGFLRACFEPDSIEEQEKDKEIEYERNQWGYWK